jgi:hypothetical protein
MKLVIWLSAAMFLTPSAHAILGGQIDLPEFNGGAPAPQRIDAAFPAETGASRSGGSLIGSTFEWARNQQAAWGAGIPGLTTSEGRAACGPIAAEALVRFFANDPNLDKIAEIFNYAKNTGLWNGAMQGAEAERKLLVHYNIQVDNVIWVSDLGSGETQIVGSLRQGKPVIISTNRHYFFVEGYNEGSRRFFVGYTGQIMGNYGGTAQMTLSQISNAGNGALALLIPK